MTAQQTTEQILKRPSVQFAIRRGQRDALIPEKSRYSNPYRKFGIELLREAWLIGFINGLNSKPRNKQ